MDEFEKERQRRLQVAQERHEQQLKQRHDAILSSFRENRSAYAAWDQQCKVNHEASVAAFKQARRHDKDFVERRESERQERAEKQRQQRQVEAMDAINEVEHTLRRLGRDGSEETPTSAREARVENIKPNTAIVAEIRARKEDDLRARKDRLTRQFRMEAEQGRLADEIVARKKEETLLDRARQIAVDERTAALARRVKRVSKIIAATENESARHFDQTKIQDAAAEQDKAFSQIAMTNRQEESVAFGERMQLFHEEQEEKRKAKHADAERFCKLAVEQLLSLVGSVVDHNTEKLSDGNVLYRATPLAVSKWRSMQAEAFGDAAIEATRMRLQKQAARERHANKKRFQLTGTLNSALVTSLSSDGSELSSIGAASPLTRRLTGGEHSNFDGDGTLPLAQQQPGLEASDAKAANTKDEIAQSLMDEVERFLASTAAYDAAQCCDMFDSIVSDHLQTESSKVEPREATCRLANIVFGHELSVASLSSKLAASSIASGMLTMEDVVKALQPEDAPPEMKSDSKKPPPKKVAMDRAEVEVHEITKAEIGRKVAERIIDHKSRLEHTKELVADQQQRQEKARLRERELEELGEESDPANLKVLAEPPIEVDRPLLLSGFPLDDADFRSSLAHTLEEGGVRLEGVCGLFVQECSRTLFRRLQHTQKSAQGLTHPTILPLPQAGPASRLTFPEIFELTHEIPQRVAKGEAALTSLGFVSNTIHVPYCGNDENEVAELSNLICTFALAEKPTHSMENEGSQAPLLFPQRTTFQSRISLIHQSIRENEVRMAMFLRRCVSELLHSLRKTYTSDASGMSKQDRWSFCDEQRRIDMEALTNCVVRLNAKQRASLAVNIVAVSSLLHQSAQQLYDVAVRGVLAENDQVSIVSSLALPDATATEMALKDEDSVSFANATWSQTASNISTLLSDLPVESTLRQRVVDAWNSIASSYLYIFEGSFRHFQASSKTIMHCADQWSLRRYSECSANGLPSEPPSTFDELLSISMLASGKALSAFQLRHLLHHLDRAVLFDSSSETRTLVASNFQFVHGVQSAQIALLGLYLEVDDDDDEEKLHIGGDLAEEALYLPGWWCRRVAEDDRCALPLYSAEHIDQMFSEVADASSAKISVTSWLAQLVSGRLQGDKSVTRIKFAPLAAARSFGAAARAQLLSFETFYNLPWWFTVDDETKQVIENLWTVYRHRPRGEVPLSFDDLCLFVANDTTNLKTLEKVVAFLSDRFAGPSNSVVPSAVRGTHTSLTVNVSHLLELFPTKLHLPDFEVLLDGGSEFSIVALTSSHWGKQILQHTPSLCMPAIPL